MITLIITVGLLMVRCIDGNCTQIHWPEFEFMTGLELIIEIGILRIYRKRD